MDGITLKNLEPRDPNPDGCLESAPSENNEDSHALKEFEYLEQVASLDGFICQNNSTTKEKPIIICEQPPLEFCTRVPTPDCVEYTNNNAFEGETTSFLQAPEVKSRKVARFRPKIEVDHSQPFFAPTSTAQMQIGYAPSLPKHNIDTRDSFVQASEILELPNPSNDINNDSLPMVLPPHTQSNGPALVLTENLKSWIDKLEVEIKNCQERSEKLKKSRAKLDQDLAEFESQKRRFNEEIRLARSTFETYKDSELAKLKKDRRVLDEYSQSIKNYPTKVEREQIEALRMELTCAKQEFELKESRLNNQLTNARFRVSGLEKERQELQDRVVNLEAELLRGKSLTNTGSGDIRIDRGPSIDSVNQGISERFSRSHSTNRLCDHLESGKRTSSVQFRPSSSKIAAHVQCHVEDIPPIVPKFPSTSRLNLTSQKDSLFQVKPPQIRTQSLENLYKWPEFKAFPRDEIVNTIRNPDGSQETHYRNGLLVINFTNGSVKELYPDRKTAIVSLFNGDLKRTLADGRIVYHYAADGSIQTTYPDGVDELRHPDGKVELISANSETGKTKPSKELPLVIPPTMNSVSAGPDGEKFLEFRKPNGEVELHCPSFKRRIYPDGNVKTVYANGTHETRYVNGRIRIRDSHGNLIVDTYQDTPKQEGNSIPNMQF
ncbi:hypothetical protein Ciccas_005639 [Cichlidogyrus casuarinus]|uniref:Centromere protein J C-terminal domain-containing protein n=1 Tax=Cichlidogyrus casuarinus TaxID=1844966 RepID=A0ABD2Q836_9PLAT